MSPTHAAASLAQGAVGGARGVVRLDGVEWTDLDTLVARNAGGLDFAFGHAEEIAEGENRAAGADVLAPESPAKDAEEENAQEEQNGDDVPRVEPGVQIPAPGHSQLQRLDQKKEGPG